ncbi:MAG TPA: hypothetical protein VGO69_09550 [Pyrinomonadaceae bacterium]|jgi:hypothetical protein|nr:hypothetical protein [Pyrinomonadaceae bacterium]
MSNDDYSNSLLDVEALVREFEACTLVRERWTHEAHLTVGLWYLARHDQAEATALIREGIKRYNQACGIQQTETSGYHETITLFYVRVIRRYLEEKRVACSLSELASGLMKACGDRTLPFEYYSRERLLSWAARTRWVEPDLKPLD